MCEALILTWPQWLVTGVTIYAVLRLCWRCRNGMPT